MTSILQSIKKLLGIDESIDHFDTDIIIFINSAFNVLLQLGVLSEGFNITGSTETWDDVLQDRMDISLVKSFIYLKVKILFDPPTSQSVLDAFQKEILQHEWRLNTQVEPPVVEEEVEEDEDE